MMFPCMCASEECQVLGCARMRDLLAKYNVTTETRPNFQIRPVATPPRALGWVCPVCRGVNGPAAMVCMHCPKPTTTGEAR